MPVLLAINWWAVALRGLFGILFGIIALVLPGAALTGLVLVFGTYALLDGIFAIAAAVVGGHKQPRWGSLLVEGIIGILAGAVTFVFPSLTVLALVALTAAWAILTGVLEIAAAVRLRKAIQGEWMLGLSGAISVLLGVALLWMPIAGAVVLTWWIGAYFLVAGMVQLALGFKLRRLGRMTEAGPEALAA